MNEDVTDERLDLEFAYTTWADSCQDTYGLSASGEPIMCRRPAKHKQSHASGFGHHRIRWAQSVEDAA